MDFFRQEQDNSETSLPRQQNQSGEIPQENVELLYFFQATNSCQDKT